MQQLLEKSTFSEILSVLVFYVSPNLHRCLQHSGEGHMFIPDSLTFSVIEVLTRLNLVNIQKKKVKKKRWRRHGLASENVKIENFIHPKERQRNNLYKDKKKLFYF